MSLRRVPICAHFGCCSSISDSDSDLQTQLFPRAESVSRSVLYRVVYLGLYPQVLNTYTAFPRAQSDFILRLSSDTNGPRVLNLL